MDLLKAHYFTYYILYKFCEELLILDNFKSHEPD